ncbi:VOC family protein [Photobacterium sp. DNB23_23_1]
MNPYPRTFSHIGISVPDLEAAVKFYKNPEDNFEYWKTGIFHFCVQDPDVEGLAEKVVAAGGKKRMKAPRYYYPGEKPYRMIYMEDPFGNILEIYSHSYELTYSAGAYN